MNVKYLIVLVLLLSFSSGAQTKEYIKLLNTYYDGFPTISAEDAFKKIKDDDVFFLDVREMVEYNVSHIGNASNIGYAKFKIERISHLPKSAEIIVYCSIGARSQEIGKRLKKAGYTNVLNLYGGIFHWSNLNYPLSDLWGHSTIKIHGYSKDWGKWIIHGDVVY